MSIDSVFTKLQNNRRRQYEDLAKRQARENAVGAFSNVAGKFLGSVLSDTLRDSANNFINSAPIMNERIQAKIADDRKTRIGAIQSQIDASGKSTYDYLFDQHLPAFEEGYRAELAEREGEEGWRDFAANPDVFDADIRKRLGEIITPMAENHDEAYALSQRVGTYEDFSAMVDLSSKNAKPTSVMGLLSRELRGAISGKSRQDFEDEALLAIQQGPLAQNRDAFNTFMERYEETKDVVKSAKFTDFVHQLEAPTDRERVDTVESITSVGTGVNFRLIRQVQEKRTDRFTGEVVTTVREPEVIFDATADDPVLAGARIREALQNNVNYAEDVLNEFSPQGITEFGKRVQAEGYAKMGDYTSKEQWDFEGKLFTEMVKNPAFIKNADLTARRAALYDLIANDAAALEQLTLDFSKDELSDNDYSNQRDDLLRRVMQNMTRAYNLSASEEYQPQ